MNVKVETILQVEDSAQLEEVLSGYATVLGDIGLANQPGEDLMRSIIVAKALDEDGPGLDSNEWLESHLSGSLALAIPTESAEDALKIAEQLGLGAEGVEELAL